MLTLTPEQKTYLIDRFAEMLAPMVEQAPYQAVTDRIARPVLSLPAPAVGVAFDDPAFGSVVVRLTDAQTLNGRSLRTPSSAHANAWSQDGSAFYVTSTNGQILWCEFDREALRVRETVPLPFSGEPTFSYLEPRLLYGVSGAGRVIAAWTRAGGVSLLDLDTVVPGLASPRTYVGGVYSSAGPVEKIATFFGGEQQGRHHYICVFESENPSERILLDTLTLGFRVHAIAFDRSGRYVYITPVSGSGVESQIWDTETNEFTHLIEDEPVLNGGHDGFGYGRRVNQACGGSGEHYDAAQWQLRNLLTPLNPTALIDPLNAPKHVHMADHPSWHHDTPEGGVPFITGIYRNPIEASAWRAWDDEILAVEPVRGGRVWRFCHHRSDVRHDVNAPPAYGFWYTPRPQVSPDGKAVLFTSNWEKTLGTDPGAEAWEGNSFRQDVFLCELR